MPDDGAARYGINLPFARRVEIRFCLPTVRRSRVARLDRFKEKPVQSGRAVNGRGFRCVAGSDVAAKDEMGSA